MHCCSSLLSRSFSSSLEYVHFPSLRGQYGTGCGWDDHRRSDLSWFFGTDGRSVRTPKERVTPVGADEIGSWPERVSSVRGRTGSSPKVLPSTKSPVGKDSDTQCVYNGLSGARFCPRSSGHTHPPFCVRGGTTPATCCRGLGRVGGSLWDSCVSRWTTQGRGSLPQLVRDGRFGLLSDGRRQFLYLDLCLPCSTGAMNRVTRNQLYL